MSAPRRSWIAHRALRGEPLQRSVVGGAEGHPVVVDLGAQREHLKAAGVGEEVAGPAGEAVQAAERLDHLDPGPQHQVVGVGQDDLRSELVEIPASSRRTAPRVPTGMKHGVVKRPSRRLHHAGPGQTRPGPRS